jgi:hypothetical protein
MAKIALREDGCDFDTVEAESPEAALDTISGESLANTTSPRTPWTIWVKIHAIDLNTEETASRKYAIHPSPPKCSDGSREHAWESPHAILGGLAENPGVWGHGGGVISHEVCMRCGCERTTDTWAQDRSDGEQGLESVAYEAGKYADELRQDADGLTPSQREELEEVAAEARECGFTGHLPAGDLLECAAVLEEAELEDLADRIHAVR